MAWDWSFLEENMFVDVGKSLWKDANDFLNYIGANPSDNGNNSKPSTHTTVAPTVALPESARIKAVKNQLSQGSARTDALKNQLIAGLLYSDYKKIQDKLDYYNSFKQNPDWEEKSQIPASSAKWSAEHYDFSRGIRAYEGKKMNNYYAEYIRMSDEEKLILNYLVQTDRDKADEYFDDLKDGLSKKVSEDRYQAFKDFGAENPFGSAMLSVGTAFFSPVDAIGNLAEGLTNAITGNGFTYDTTNDSFVNTTNALREGVSEDMGTVGKFIFGTGMSIVDNVVRLPFGAVGAGFMAMGQAAAQGMVAGKEMGMDDWQAAIYGIVVGAVEGLTEKIPIDKLLDKTLLAKSVKGYILKNVIAEAGEEAVSEAADKLFQAVISWDDSEWHKEYEAYRAQGYSKAEAIKKIIANSAGDVGLAALSGAISGGVMAGGGVALNTIKNVPKNYSLGQVVTNGTNITPELLAAAEAAKSSRIDNTARKLANAKTITGQNYQRGKLTQQVMAEAYEKLHPYGDGKRADKRQMKADAKRMSNEQMTTAEEFEQSDFGKKYNTFKEKFDNKVNNYETIQKSKTHYAMDENKKIGYITSDDGKTYIAEKDEDGNLVFDSNGAVKGKEVEITAIDEVREDAVRVKLSDGSVVPATDLLLPEDVAKQYAYAAWYNNTDVAKAFLSGYSNYEGTIEAYAEEFMTAYKLGRDSGTRGLPEMIKTLPKSRQKTFMQNDAIVAAFDAGKAIAKKRAEDIAKMKKARDAKK